MAMASWVNFVPVAMIRQSRFLKELCIFVLDIVAANSGVQSKGNSLGLSRGMRGVSSRMPSCARPGWCSLRCYVRWAGSLDDSWVSARVVNNLVWITITRYMLGFSGQCTPEPDDNGPPPPKHPQSTAIQQKDGGDGGEISFTSGNRVAPLWWRLGGVISGLDGDDDEGCSDEYEGEVETVDVRGEDVDRRSRCYMGAAAIRVR